MHNLRFLADMNISPLTVAHLKDRGWDILRVSEVMDQSTKDLVILGYAREYDKIIITQDLDFSKLLAIRGFRKPSLINLRLTNPKPEMITTRVIEVVASLVNELQSGIVVTVDEDSIRYRTLPIKTE